MQMDPNNSIHIYYTWIYLPNWWGIFFSMQKKVTYSVEIFSYQEHEENQVRD